MSVCVQGSAWSSGFRFDGDVTLTILVEDADGKQLRFSVDVMADVGMSRYLLLFPFVLPFPYIYIVF